MTADLDLCQGHRMCLLEAPEVFGFDEGADRVRVLAEHPRADQLDGVRRAVRYCPAMALTVSDEPEEEHP